MQSATPQLPQSLRKLIGSVIAGRYVVDQFVGMGGMAVVFRGRHAALDRTVAIKVLRPEYCTHPEVTARFDREARAASGFEHPNCTPVFDCGSTDDGLQFMVMQFLDGRELTTVLGRPLPPSQCVSIALQITRGLEHAHLRGVVHRDLKPDNIFVTYDHAGSEVIKLVDFGIARILDSDKADGLTTKVGAIVGTPAYMSPEQASGGAVDERSDLYSLGVIMFQMLAGVPPFTGGHPRVLMYQHVTTQPPELPPTIPASIRSIVSKLLAKNRASRSQSATETLNELEAAFREIQVDPTPWIRLLDQPAPAPGKRHETELYQSDEVLNRRPAPLVQSKATAEAPPKPPAGPRPVPRARPSAASGPGPSTQPADAPSDRTQPADPTAGPSTRPAEPNSASNSAANRTEILSPLSDGDPSASRTAVLVQPHPKPGRPQKRTAVPPPPPPTRPKTARRPNTARAGRTDQQPGGPRPVPPSERGDGVPVPVPGRKPQASPQTQKAQASPKAPPKRPDPPPAAPVPRPQRMVPKEPTPASQAYSAGGYVPDSQHPVAGPATSGIPSYVPPPHDSPSETHPINPSPTPDPLSAVDSALRKILDENTENAEEHLRSEIFPGDSGLAPQLAELGEDDSEEF